MASSGSQNSGQNFFGAISIPATSLGNITITSCSTGVKYKLYPVECFSPPQKSRGYPMGNEYLQYLASATLFAGIAAGPNSPATNQSSRIVGTSIATGNRASSAVGISTIAGILPSETALQCTKRKCTRFVVPCSKRGDLYVEDSEGEEGGLTPNRNQQRRILSTVLQACLLKLLSPTAGDLSASTSQTTEPANLSLYDVVAFDIEDLMVLLGNPVAGNEEHPVD
ncbi:hypothetical protein M9H77_26362 [Catharanthus roseus]|uniref:Uncharacterized protein n=1 Tax=Catharanthus roseus TaxID=4058 RepID=A0ACC0ABL7_CATRO|nr:hypothetical protein M9H77_26362 [Catharanthus roseus]